MNGGWRAEMVVLAFAALATPTATESVAQPALPLEDAVPAASRENLAERLNRLLADPALERAHVGLAVQLAESGEVLYTRAGEKRFTPASTVKLVTAAVGLEVLGPGHRWSTGLHATGPVLDGELQGDLWIVGSGDPLLTRDELRTWVVILREAGIERIAGDVVADDRAFDHPQWGAGWMWDGLHGGWSAGISGLQLSKNSVRATLVAGTRVGDPARLRFEERGPAIPIRNEVRTGPPGSAGDLRLHVPPEGGPRVITGWIPRGARIPMSLATAHPTLYLLEYLELVLADSAVGVGGEFRLAAEEETQPSATWTHDLVSDSLGLVLGELLRPSDNQIAESVLRTIGLEAGDAGSSEAGLEIVEETLSRWGIDPEAAALADGSGLSRYNQLTPNALNRLLRELWRHPHFETFFAALPIAGDEGTLEYRMRGTAAEANARAKTGSLDSVRSLAGYVDDRDGETLIFSLLVNGYDAPGSVANALEDLIVEQLALFSRDAGSTAR